MGYSTTHLVVTVFGYVGSNTLQRPYPIWWCLRSSSSSSSSSSTRFRYGYPETQFDVRCSIQSLTAQTGVWRRRLRPGGPDLERHAVASGQCSRPPRPLPDSGRGRGRRRRDRGFGRALRLGAPREPALCDTAELGPKNCATLPRGGPLGPRGVVSREAPADSTLGRAAAAACARTARGESETEYKPARKIVVTSRSDSCGSCRKSARHAAKFSGTSGSRNGALLPRVMVCGLKSWFACTTQYFAATEAMSGTGSSGCGVASMA